MPIVYCNVFKCKNFDPNTESCGLDRIYIEETDIDSIAGPIPGAECSSCNHTGTTRMPGRSLEG